jgi:hypothetical protein
LSAITIPVKGSRYSIKISHYELSLRKSLKRSKPSSNTKGDALLFTIIRITSQLEIIIEVENNKDITRLIQSCISNPSRLQLIEELLL